MTPELELTLTEHKREGRRLRMVLMGTLLLDVGLLIAWVAWSDWVRFLLH